MTDETQRLRAALERIHTLTNGYISSDFADEIAAIAAAALNPTPAPDTRPELTYRQLEILEFIKAEIANGYPPTVREIGEQFEIKSPNGVRIHLVALQKKGYLRWNPAKSRTLAVIGGAS